MSRSAATTPDSGYGSLDGTHRPACFNGRPHDAITPCLKRPHE
jgi:hypothetical protein